MEQEKFTAGQDISLFKIQEWNIAPTICFDLRFPELYRDAVKAGANLLTVQDDLSGLENLLIKGIHLLVQIAVPADMDKEAPVVAY